MSRPILTPTAALPTGLALRKPTVGDVGDIIQLLQPDMLAEHLLPRTHRQVAERLRDYTVAVRAGVVVGVASISVVDLHLAEVGVLTTSDDEVERSLMNTLLLEAQEMGVRQAFVLTGDGARFEALGFARTTISDLPEKRDRQCLRCSRLPRCRQVALHRPIEPMVLRASA